VWQAFGPVDNYVEPFAGSAAMLLAAPDRHPGKPPRIETINDADGFVANFWRAIAHDPEATAHHADWPCNEVDMFARHSWLVRQTARITEQLHADPDWFDALGDELLFLIDGFVDNSSYTKFTLYIDKFFKDRTKKINYEVRIEFNYKSTSDLNSYTWVNGKTNDRYDLTKTSKHGNAEYIKMKLTNYLKHRK
jgi:hypothetical protein